MFKHFRNTMLTHTEDLVLTPEDIKVFKANQARSYHAVKNASILGEGAKVKVKQK